MGTSTLSRFQRGALAQLVNEGNKSYQVMADALGVAKATISYELDRVKPYDPELAQQDADRKRRNCGRRSMLTAALATLTKYKIKESVRILYYISEKQFLTARL